MQMNNTILKAESITKNFDTTKVLENISISVGKGECFTLLGKSGSGKTTLLMCLSLLEIPSSGKISFLGREVFPFVSERSKDRKRIVREFVFQTGFVFQNFYLWPHLTALENVIESLITVRKMGRDEAIRVAEEVLHKVNVFHRKDAKPEHLSGGETQRVAIARAIVLNPKILFLDEITSNIDPENVFDVYLILKKLLSEGTSIMMVTHHLELAKRLSNRCAFLDSGKIVETNDVTDFFSNPSDQNTRKFLEEITLREESL